MTIDPLAWQADLEALRKMPQRYARAVDSHDYDSVAELFHPEGFVEGVRGSSAVPAYLEAMRNMPRTFDASMHFMADPMINLSPGDDEASMDTYAVVYQLRGNTAEGDLTLGMQYHDQLVRHAGRWVIKHRSTRTIWMRGALPS